jgi:hypothetical protein
MGHPLIFILPDSFAAGHPAVLYINKFRVAGLLEDGIDQYFEQVGTSLQEPGYGQSR